MQVTVKGGHLYQVPRIRPNYGTYRSPHGPQYKVNPNFHGIDALKTTRFVTGMALFGGAVGIGAFFLVSDIPRIRMDIMQKIPIIGNFYVKEVAPEDNPF